MTKRFRIFVALTACLLFISPSVRAQTDHERLADRTRGMLIGSLIGDAMGGPVEFKSPTELTQVLPDLRKYRRPTRSRRFSMVHIA